jgi:hypothetical protein
MRCWKAASFCFSLSTGLASLHGHYSTSGRQQRADVSII